MKNLYKAAWMTGLLAVATGCTNLDPILKDDVVAGNFLNTPADYAAAVATPYQQLTNLSQWHWLVMDHTSDALTIYTHQSGWNNDRHRRTDTHELLESDNKRFPLGGTMWSPIFDGIAKTNGAIEFLKGGDPDIAAPYLAELRALRGFYYLLGMDAYGGMPIVEAAAPTPGTLPERNTAVEVFEFITSEFEEVIPLLPSKGDADFPGFPRISKEAAQGILALVYLNGEVYTRSDFAQPGSGTTYYDEALELIDEIIDGGQFGLVSNYAAMFDVDNETQEQEFLFYVDHKTGITGGAVGYPIWSLTLEWVEAWTGNLGLNSANGPAVEPAFFRYYLDHPNYQNDKRFLFNPETQEGNFLYGVQYTPAGDTLKDTQGRIIDHSIDFYLRPQDGPADYQALYEGVRIIKWWPDPTGIDRQADNGFPIIRYADLLLMKAEIILRKKGATSVNGVIDDAITDPMADELVNMVRERAFDDYEPLTGVTLLDVYDERGLELYAEAAHRRRDQIRFDTHHIARESWQTAQGPEFDRYKSLFPVPGDERAANPNLWQNTGY
ncbi:RagB/SusD family nutrient uptake outer membrane protein [Pontibacter sp. G13]|uniref:RagB/SusD family nutrient uptake outer membrane protein n=1 Tax=Pontibacter sp. G13 TaxID=3074898 RepID=UPI00288AB44F|nr:RagB/SusD family nutrient uptake outer membrane protein [Pontibacter sp. G13]WNJ19134.1 RagB/SusD family nutrient uptake outer membrane protein [Pontibacter sp. G13]